MHAASRHARAPDAPPRGNVQFRLKKDHRQTSIRPSSRSSAHCITNCSILLHHQLPGLRKLRRCRSATYAIVIFRKGCHSHDCDCYCYCYYCCCGGCCCSVTCSTDVSTSAAQSGRSASSETLVALGSQPTSGDAPGASKTKVKLSTAGS